MFETLKTSNGKIARIVLWGLIVEWIILVLDEVSLISRIEDSEQVTPETNKSKIIQNVLISKEGQERHDLESVEILEDFSKPLSGRDEYIQDIIKSEVNKYNYYKSKSDSSK